MRRIHAVLVAALAVTVLAGFAPPAVAAAVTYTQPVTGRVTDPFRPPANPYGAGNRGLTYETQPGSPVRASASGRVTFAGQVGGALHVVVRHADGVRTSYSFLRSIAVRNGQSVAQGDAVGTTGSSFHFGARIGDAYVDPAILLESGPARVHLVPDGEFTEDGAHDDHKALLTIVGDRIGAVSKAAVGWARAGVSAGQGGADALFAAAADVAAIAANASEAEVRAMAQHLVTILDDIVNLGEFAGSFATLASALADVVDAFLDACTPPDHETPTAPPERIAVFVAGLGSHSGGPHADDNLSRRFGDLGYAADHVYDFSYKGGRHPQAYAPEDTVRDLRADAADLRDLLDQVALEHPGAQVDLIAHSQGGLIAREALADTYNGAGHTLPTIAHFVTVGTPNHGTDAATALAWLRWTEGGRAVRTLAHRVHKPFDLTGPGVAQLSETSQFIHDINKRPLRPGVAYTSIAASRDIVVPAPRARLRDATNVLVDVGSWPWESHSALTTAQPAHREVALAVNDAPPTCQSVTTVANRALTGFGIATAEDTAGVAAVGTSAAP
ncbi:MAG: hypothetical protein QOJ00_867 [Actinomycetota bacterium]